jgi:hypothetical protein
MSDAPRILGADPGISGAVAMLCGGAIEAWDAPVAGGELDTDELARIVRDAKPDFAVIERVSSMPKQGVASTFKFGMSYGALRAVIAVCGVPQHLVTPAAWKKFYRLSSDKEASRALAIRLWPGCGLFNLKKHEARAKAALIACYGMEVLRRQQ